MVTQFTRCAVASRFESRAAALSFCIAGARIPPESFDGVRCVRNDEWIIAVPKTTLAALGKMPGLMVVAL